MPLSPEHRRAIGRGVRQAQRAQQERRRCPHCDRKGGILNNARTYYEEGETITQCRYCETTFTFSYRKEG